LHCNFHPMNALLGFWVEPMLKVCQSHLVTSISV
jgi:hypothetical protein